MTDHDLNRLIRGVVEEFATQNNGPVPRDAVLTYCEEMDAVSLPRKTLAEQLDLLIQRGDIRETDEGVIDA